ncbi:MAG: site-specific integrase [Methylotenera sp.]|nr:site-specific integrase [Methylotenera sp.]MDO9389156.1 site-specific integrase [Methylotenera sp.]
MIVKLTESFISNGLQCSAGKRREEVIDALMPGFFVEIRASSSGQGTYYFRYKDVNGHTQTKKLGRTTDITLAEARSHAKELRAQVDLGQNPRAAEKARKLVVTFDTFFKEHYLPYVIPRKRSWGRDEELYRLRISKKLGFKKLNELTRQQVQSFQSELLAEGLAPATVNHHTKLIRRMLNLAVEWEMIEKNPVSRISMLAEMNQKERYLSEEELVRLVKVLKTDSCRSVSLIMFFLLSTGARLNEVLSATWDQVDRERKVWRIPALNSKSKRLRVVPLNESAFDVINQLETEHKFDHLFINFKSKKPYVSIHKVWDKLRTKAQLPEMRIHDARHFFCGALASSGRTLYEIQVLAGHSDPKTTMRYSAISSKVLQSASSTASDIIKGAMKQEIPVAV